MNFLEQVQNSLRTVGSLTKKLTGVLSPEEEETTLDEWIDPVATTQHLASVVGFEHDFRQLVRTCLKMYGEDPRVSQTIQTMARDATKNGFDVKVEGRAGKKRVANRAQVIVDELLARIDFDDKVEQWVRSSLKNGNLYLVQGINTNGDIITLQKMPVLSMTRHSDTLDRFYEPQQAFSWHASFGGVYDYHQIERQYFPQWAMVHARYDHEDNQRYGRPLYASALKPYHFIEDGERNLWLRRKLRSGVRYLHKIVGGPAKVAEYKRINKDALTNPASAVTDYFGQAEIEALAGDARLSEIRDIIHLVETFSIAAPLPLALIGYGNDINRDILAQKLLQYDESVTGLKKWITKQILEPIMRTQLLLKGILPENVIFRVEWSSKQDLSPERLDKIAEAGVRLKAMGLKLEDIVKILGPLLPNIDFTKMDLSDEGNATPTLELPRSDNPSVTGREGVNGTEPEEEEEEDVEDALQILEELGLPRSVIEAIPVNGS